MTTQTTDIYCPECGQHAEDMPTQDWPASGLEYRHVADRTALWPIPSRRGEPVEYTTR